MVFTLTLETMQSSFGGNDLKLKLKEQNCTHEQQWNSCTLVWNASIYINTLSEETERKAASACRNSWILFSQNPTYGKLPEACGRTFSCPEVHCNGKLWNRGCSPGWKKNKFKLKCSGVGTKEKLYKCKRTRKVQITDNSRGLHCNKNSRSE